jgi:zinc protease
VHDVETYRFDNGLTLHVADGHHARVAAVQAWVGVGSADDPPAQAGIAHVVEHMLFRGATPLAPALAKRGGEVNAWTSFDHTVYHAVLGSADVEAAIDAFADVLTSPRVDPDELAREREVILEEQRHHVDSPSRGVMQGIFQTAYVEHPYRRPIIGSADTVGRLRERDVVEFFRGHYVADNLALVVAGDVDAERVRRAVERRFRMMPSGRKDRRRPVEPTQTAPRATCAERDIGEAHLAIGFRAPPARHPDLAALDVAALVLGSGESARLPRALRDDAELVTSVSAAVHALRDPGLFVVSATARPGRARRAIAGLVDQVAALADGVSDDELDAARVAAEAAAAHQLETAQGHARDLGWHASIAGDPRFGHVYLDRVRAVRSHDVAAAVRRYLRGDAANIAAIVPVRRGKSIAAAFARGAEVKARAALSAAPAPPAIAERRVVLASGAVLLVRRDPAVPVVAMRAVWRGGQRAEDDARAGASVLLGRTIVRGCGDRDAATVARDIDRLGGSLAGVSGRNSFGLAAEWVARSWHDGLDLLADCILAPALPADELAREQRLLRDDQALQGDNPTQLAFRLFATTLYGDHPYHRDALGSPAILDLTRRQLAAFYRDRYPVSELTLAIVGDIDLDDAVARVTARLGGVPRAATARAVAAPPLPRFDGKPAAARDVYGYLDRAQAYLVVGFPGATIAAPDRFALEVLIAILDGQSGRLFATLRDDQALVYKVSAHSVEGVDPGFVAIYLSCAPDKLDRAVAAVRGELTRLRDDGVTDDEVQRAERYLIGTHQVAMQRRAAIANAMAYHEAYGLGWQQWSGYDDAIRAVRRDDVAAAIATYLRDDRAITATVRPPAATGRFGSQGRTATPKPSRKSITRSAKAAAR